MSFFVLGYFGIFFAEMGKISHNLSYTTQRIHQVLLCLKIEGFENGYDLWFFKDNMSVFECRGRCSQCVITIWFLIGAKTTMYSNKHIQGKKNWIEQPCFHSILHGFLIDLHLNRYMYKYLFCCKTKSVYTSET